MKHIVYCTSNQVNGKFYIGKHSTKNFNDNYLGSGKNLLRAIKKYGRDNFIRTTICECQTEEKAFTMEQYYIGLLCNRKNSYNIAEGGCGCRLTDRTIIGRKISKALTGKRRTAAQKERMSKAQLKRHGTKAAYCSNCGKRLRSYKIKMCRDCYIVSIRKVKRPPKEQLIREISQLGYRGTGRKYGVSDNSIRKWL